MIKPILFSIIIALPHPSHAALCKNGIGGLISQLRQRYSFQRSVRRPVADYHTKRETIEKLGIPNADDAAIAGYISDPQSRITFLQKQGFTDKEIDLLKRHNILTALPMEDIRYRTLPPAHGPYIRVGAQISTANEKGNLENVVVTQLEGNSLQVVSPRNGYRFTIDRSKAYRPVKKLQGAAIYEEEENVPLYHWIDGIDERNSVTFADTDLTVSMDELKLRPRPGTSTYEKDFSSPIGFKKALRLATKNRKLRMLYKLEGASEDFIAANNALIKELQREMHKQGIWSTLWQVREGIFSLIVVGVHPNGNKIARLYLKALEQQENQLLSISSWETVCLHDDCIGFLTYASRVNVDSYITIEMLQHERGMDIFHETRHQMFKTRRRLGLMSVFDHTISLGKQADRNLDDQDIHRHTGRQSYQGNMSLEEIYNNVYDLSFLVREMRKRGWESTTLENDFTKRANLLWKLTLNVQRIAEDIRNNFDEFVKEFSRDDHGWLSIPDSHGRYLNIFTGSTSLRRADKFLDVLETRLEEIGRLASSVLARKPIIDGILAEGNKSGGFSRLSREMLLLRRLMQEQIHH